jgi:quercetin dioxygenase-like cupin family protein
MARREEGEGTMLQTMAKATRFGVEIRGAAGAEVLDVFGAPMTVLADGAADGMFVGLQVVPPGYFVPPHVHEEGDETFYILDGHLTLLGPAGERSAGPGDLVMLPAAMPHGFRNDGATPSRSLVLCRPGLRLAEMFRHFDRAGKAAPGGLRPDEIAAICAQYGVRMG